VQALRPWWHEHCDGGPFDRANFVEITLIRFLSFSDWFCAIGRERMFRTLVSMSWCRSRTSDVRLFENACT